MRKTFFIIWCLFASLAGMSQQRLRPQPPALQQPEPERWLQRWKELNLSADQKKRIIVIIQQQRLQKLLSQKALSEILTEDQKKKLIQWKLDKQKPDSTHP